MCPHSGKVLKDPIMISLTFFTLIFILTVSLACAQPWRVPGGSRRTRDLSEGQPVSDCLVTYHAFQPNMDYFKEKLAEITVDKCTRKKGGRESRRHKRKLKKQKKKTKKKRLKKPKNRSKTRKLPNRKRKMRKIYRELKTFRRWKSLMSRKELLADPAAQRAVSSLWSDLLEKGPQWRNVFRDLHNNDTLPTHAHHSLRTE